jgi:hypothetical protein
MNIIIQITYCYRRSLYNYNNQMVDEVEIIIETNAQINQCKSISIIFMCICTFVYTCNCSIYMDVYGCIYVCKSYSYISTLNFRLLMVMSQYLSIMKKSINLLIHIHVYISLCQKICIHLIDIGRREH